MNYKTLLRQQHRPYSSRYSDLSENQPHLELKLPGVKGFLILVAKEEKIVSASTIAKLQ